MDETKFNSIQTLYNQWVEEKPETRSVIFITSDGAENIIGIRGDTRQLKVGLACALNSDEDLRSIFKAAYAAYLIASERTKSEAQETETTNQE